MIYGQRDSKWKNKKIGKSDSSIGMYGCTITCVGMLAGITPDDVNTRLTSINGYKVDLILWHKIKKAIPWLEFEWRGYDYDNSRVLKAIKDHGGCLVEVDYDGKIKTKKDKHWVLYIGNQRMYDPWTGRECSTSKYKIKTGYSIIKVYNKDEENDMTELQEVALKQLQKAVDKGLYGNIESAARSIVDLVRDADEYKKHIKTLDLKVLKLVDKVETMSDDITEFKKEAILLKSDIGKKNLQLTELANIIKGYQAEDETANIPPLPDVVLPPKDKNIMIKIWLLFKKLFKNE